MKKLIYFLFLLFLPLSVKALVNYNITDYYIKADILNNGDLKVSELIVLDGTFHGYIRDITYKNDRLSSNTNSFIDNDIYNAKGITDMKISAKIIEDEVSFDTLNEAFKPLERVYFDADALNGDYVESSIQNGKSYKMYYEANEQSVGYLLNYTIKSPVVIHNDVAELYWTFIGDGFEDKINNLQIKVNLPSSDDSSKFLIWAHGDITGNIDKINNSSLLATMKSLDKNSPVDIRMTFEPNIITNQEALTKTNENALEKILQVETKRAEIANEQRIFAQKIYNIVKIVTILFFTFLIFWWIYVYIRFDREYKSDFTNEYNREFINRYNVEVVDYLMNGNVSANAMSASILNLIYKKNIAVTPISDDGKKKNNYQFKLINKEGVSDTEEVLLDFLFESVGKDNVFTSKDLERYAKNSKTYGSFQSKYSNWVNCVLKDGEKCQFFERNGLPVVSSIFILLIAILISFIVYYYQVDFIFAFLIAPISIIFLIYALLLKKRTKSGNEDYVRWKAFKKFLKDFGNFDIKELPEIALWERYLVYATVFGLAKEVQAAMNTKIAEDGALPEYFPNYNLYLASHIERTIFSSIEGANVAQARASRMSSGSGSGGGFSSGAGFGGGGGGGHGF